MIINRYRDIPRTYAPDVGEVIMGRRSASDSTFTKAVVVHVRRLRDGTLKVRVQWMADNEGAGILGSPIRAGDRGWIMVPPDSGPPLIEKISKGEPSS